MEHDKNKKGHPVKDSHKDFNYGVNEQGISSEQIEASEVREDKFDRDRNSSKELDLPSKDTIDPSMARKGNLSVQESNLSTEEKIDIDRKTKDIEGGGDIGEGRGSGSDRA